MVAANKQADRPEGWDEVVEFVQGLKRERQRAERKKDPNWALNVLERMEAFLDELQEGREEGDDKRPAKGSRREEGEGESNILDSIFKAR